MERVNALEALREAMRIEKEGIHFYTRSAKLAKNRDVSDLFHTLAEQELEHLEKLELVYDNLAENNEWMVMKDLMESGKGKDVPDIFEGEADEDLDEISAIDVAIRAEEESIEFYKGVFEECEKTSENGCEIFSWLIGFEKEHLKMLKNVRKTLTSK